jgi:hypothetical protein
MLDPKRVSTLKSLTPKRSIKEIVEEKEPEALSYEDKSSSLASLSIILRR